MVTRAEQKKQTRRLLIEAALSLSSKHGFSGLSLRQVTRAAGIAPNSFYRHFRDMDELGLALIDEVGMALRQLMREARTRVAARRSVIQTSIETFMEYLRENPNHFRLLLGERSGSSPAFREALYREITRFVDELSQFLEEESNKANKPLLHIPELSEAMVTIVFNVGAAAIDLPMNLRGDLAKRMNRQLRMLIVGSQMMSQFSLDLE